MNFYDGDLSCLVDNRHVGKTVSSLTILGRVPNTHATLVVSCDICKQDSELFRHGLFTTTKSELDRGRFPCGCAQSSSWEIWQTEVKIKRKLSGTLQSLVSIVTTGDKPRCVLECSIHGVLESKDIHSVLKLGGICNYCASLSRSAFHTKSDDSHIEGFMMTDKFSDGTTFTREKEYYWTVNCPTCRETYKSFIGNLKAGKIGCKCSTHNQQFSYLNILYDGSVPLCLKFGITNNPKYRIYQQSVKTNYKIDSLGVWKFPTVSSCKESERRVINSCRTGVLERREMRDGWTETTSLSELDKIMKIYEDNGGVRQW